MFREHSEIVFSSGNISKMFLEHSFLCWKSLNSYELTKTACMYNKCITTGLFLLKIIKTRLLLTEAGLLLKRLIVDCSAEKLNINYKSLRRYTDRVRIPYFENSK